MPAGAAWVAPDRATTAAAATSITRKLVFISDLLITPPRQKAWRQIQRPGAIAGTVRDENAPPGSRFRERRVSAPRFLLGTFRRFGLWDQPAWIAGYL